MSEIQEETVVEETAPPAEVAEPAPEAEVADDVGDKPIAAGAVSEEPEQEPEPEPTEDWRERWARDVAGDDDKAYQKELKALKRFDNEKALWNSYRALDARLNRGGWVQIPGEDASEEERAAYNKALGVPEKPEEYIEKLELAKEGVLGEDDKPIVESFAQALHATGATPEQFNAAINWYFAEQENRAAERDEQDDEYKVEAQAKLREELGGAYKRTVNAIPSLFNYAPGGADLENESSLMTRLLGGRMADGKLVGDDPDMIRFLANVSREINPVVSVMEGGDGTGKSIDDEIAEIEKLMRTDRREYIRTKEKRYLELLEAREKNRARNAA